MKYLHDLDDVFVCPYCMNKMPDSWRGCCGEVHGERAYIIDDEYYLIDEVIDMGYKHTYRIDRLYHQFLKPKSIGANKLEELIYELTFAGFVQIVDDDRYFETDKLINKENKDELFKIIQRLI